MSVGFRGKSGTSESGRARRQIETLQAFSGKKALFGCPVLLAIVDHLGQVTDSLITRYVLHCAFLPDV